MSKASDREAQAWKLHEKASIRSHRKHHGSVCPGWIREAHSAHDLTLTPDDLVLCVGCVRAHVRSTRADSGA